MIVMIEMMERMMMKRKAMLKMRTRMIKKRMASSV